nr:2-C-methyl-D-erythritol 2,4-cyclodiphosphate synthase [Bacillota bacterium]
HHFPPGDERYRDISSLVLLEEVRRIIAAEGYRVINVDAVLIAQEPRLAPYIEAMVANIAAALGISPGAVSVKATSTEGVGACGRQEAMAAQAVVLISHGEGD